METKGYLDEVDALAAKEKEASKKLHTFSTAEQGGFRDVEVFTMPIGVVARKVLTFVLEPDDLSLLLNPEYLPIKKVIKDLGLDGDQSIDSRLILDWIGSPPLASDLPFRLELIPQTGDRNKFGISLTNRNWNQVTPSTEYHDYEQAGRLRALYFESLSRRPNQILNEILTAGAGFVTEVLNSRRV